MIARYVVVAILAAAGFCIPSSAAAREMTLTRKEIREMPILERPSRPGHFYGNTVRRRYYRGTALPAPSDFRHGAAVLARRPYVPVDSYLRRGL